MNKKINKIERIKNKNKYKNITKYTYIYRKY